MKAITLWQPWASLIAFGWKTIETRRHGRFAGLVGQRIAIHAGRQTAQGALMMAGDYFPIPPNITHTLNETRGIVCTAIVLAHRRLTAADSEEALCPAEGLYGLIFDVDSVERLIPPIQAQGHQGIWEWDDSCLKTPESERPRREKQLLLWTRSE